MSIPAAAPPVRPSPFWQDGYRPFFLLFATWGAAFLVAWVYALSGGAAIAVADHAIVMVHGVLGSGIIGFLLTAYPRQNAATPPSARTLGLLLGGQAATQAALAASWLGAPTAMLATVLGAGVWGSVLAWALSVAVPSLRRQWEWTAAAVPVALLSALLSWLGIRLGVAGAVDLALHGFLLLLALGLLDKMVPFFSSRAVPGWSGLRRPGFIPALLVALVLRAASPVAADVVIVAALVREWTGWQPQRGVRVPLVAVLHLGFLWILVGYAAEALGAPRGACVHLWGVGGMMTLILGFGARVALGHGGQPLRLDARGALPIALVQVALALRLAFYAGQPTLTAAGLVLAAALATWAARFGPLLFTR